MMYTKLFSSIVHSSIWLEDLETKVLWITLMALMDRQGCVYGSVGGLARTAGISQKRTREILDRFLAPDPDSADLARAPEREGRRIEIVDGGWRLLNASHYRAIRDQEERREQNRAAQARARAKRAETGETGNGGNGLDDERQQESAVTSDGQQKSAPEAEADQRQIRERERKEPFPLPLPLAGSRERGRIRGVRKIRERDRARAEKDLPTEREIRKAYVGAADSSRSDQAVRDALGYIPSHRLAGLEADPGTEDDGGPF